MNPPPANQSYVQWMLTAGGTYGTAIYVLGGILTVWGLLNLAGTRNRAVVLVHIAASLLPVLVTLLAARPILGSISVVTMATSFTPPPGFLQDMGGLALRSITGPVATIVPTVLGLVQLARLQARERSSEEP